MKNKFIFVCVILALMLLVPIIFLNKNVDVSEERLNNAEVNLLIHEIEDNWDVTISDPGRVVENKYAFDYEVMDNDGRIILKTKKDLASDIGRATSEHYTIRDLDVDGKEVGKLLIVNDYSAYKNEVYNRYSRNYILCAVLEALIIAIFMVWVYHSVVKPFDKLKGFASNVAAGNLDMPLEMDRGNMFGAFTESFDIMREELQTARQKEYEAQRSKVELVAQLSHDIKTPVASIRAMSELLEAKSDDEKQKQKLGSIVSKTNQIDVMVSDLFASTLNDLEKLDATASEQPSNILEKIINDADYQDYIGDIDIEECLILCDPIRASQVINNIISNSYKYADTSIIVRSEIEDDHLNLTFTDKGGGVSEDDLPVITKRFRRGSNSDGKPGAGLGLAIASELMEKMGGGLECSNVEGGFRVKLLFRLADS